MPVLVINCGSSSVKLALLETEGFTALCRGQVQRIGEPGPGLRQFRDGSGEVQDRESCPTHAAALEWLADRLRASPVPAPRLAAHRVVQGGERFRTAALLTDEVVAELERLSPLAPLHNPPSLAGIAAARRLFPGLPQVACFDTAFHSGLPERAFRYALPEVLYRKHGVRRYGFHGHSHHWSAERLAVRTGRSDLRQVSLHLGRGCSAAALRGGRSMDTSMGMTPLEGLVMGTRCGDIDPGLPLALQGWEGWSVEETARVLYEQSGLAGIAGGTGDMREVCARAASGDEPAARALEVFCYRAARYAAALTVAIGGLDALSFTGGIGENSPEVRARICALLPHLGVATDPQRNLSGDGERCISPEGAPVSVWVIPADEEQMIAREALEVVGTG